MQKQANLPVHFPNLEFFSMESPLPSDWAWGTFSWITMLRRPEDRTLSAYYWWLQRQNDNKNRFDLSDGVLMYESQPFESEENNLVLHFALA